MGKKITKKGRPKAITTDTIVKLEHAFSKGCNISEACLFAGIDNSTFYRNIGKDSEIYNRLMRLKEKPTLHARFNVVKAIEDKDLDTSKWYLERKVKDEFSTRQEVDNNSDIVINLVSNRQKLIDKP